jgi:hypothetical protein
VAGRVLRRLWACRIVHARATGACRHVLAETMTWVVPKLPLPRPRAWSLAQLTVSLPALLCSFLYEPNSQGYKYYRQKLEEFRKARAGSAGTPTDLDLSLKRRSPPEAPSGPSPQPTTCPTFPAPTPASAPSPAVPGKPASTTTVKRKRKSRWGPEEDKVELPPAELVPRDVDAAPSPLSGGLTPSPVMVCSAR